MRVYFAPLEGVTDAIFRRVFAETFGGMDKYFLPFVSPSASQSYTLREEYDFSPAQNRGLFAVPQILAKNAEYFLGAARAFRDMGYTEVNLNLGCPSGTVTGKGKGSAMLRDGEALRRFLDAVYADAPLPISIKTRIGYDDPLEWEALLPIFADYPIHELIIHSRTRNQLYRGTPCHAAFGRALQILHCPLIYNGDLFDVDDLRRIEENYPDASGMMLGRGVLANPALVRAWRGGEALQMADLTYFHDQLLRAYLTRWPESAAVGKMHVFLRYFCHCLEYSARAFRDAMKANSLEAYQDGAAALFAQAVLKTHPAHPKDE